MLDASASRTAFAGFFIHGLLLSFLGAVLPAWGYHLQSNYAPIGNYFLSLSFGMILGGRLSPKALARGAGWTLSVSCAGACGALLFLAFVSPPASSWWRLVGLFLTGISAGLLSAALLRAVWPAYQYNPAATINLSGILFGLGCLTSSLLVAGTFYIYTVPSIVVLIAILPFFFAGIFARTRFPAATPAQPPPGQVWEDFRSPGAILLSLLLFFQFGNEWAVAGWLPLFLIQRLGISPAVSLQVLAVYWTALLAGRVIAQALLPRGYHRRLLTVGPLVALFGCLILSFTNNRFGAIVAVLFIGGGFSVIYPLVIEMIGHRYNYFHPGVLSGAFYIAMLGGLLAPATLGYVADFFGLGTVMALPLAGTCMVVILLFLIWIEAKLSGKTAPAPAR